MPRQKKHPSKKDKIGDTEQQLRATIQELQAEISEQKKPEENFRNQRDLYRAIMENDHFGFALIGLNHKILLVNNMMSKFFQKPASGLIGKKCFREFQKRKTICHHCPGTQAIATGQPAEIETEGVRDNGSRFSVRFQTFPTLDSDGAITGFIEIVQDITERKKAEESLKAAFQQLQASEQQLKAANQQLQASEQQLKAANQQLQASEQQLKAANQQLQATNQQLRASQEKIRALAKFPSENPNPVLRISKDGIVIYSNDAGLTLLNAWTTEPGKRLPDKWCEFIADVLKTGLSKDTELEYNSRIFSLTFAPVVDANYVNVYGLDITRRKQAELALKRERDKAQKYLDVAAVIMVAIDSEGRVGLINRKGCEVLGYTEDEILGKNWFNNFLPKSVRDNIKEIFNKVLAGDADGPEYYENPVLTKSGDERLIAWHNTVLRDDKGDVMATLSSGMDITEHKKMEEVLQKSEHEKTLVLDNASEIIAYHDKDNNILWANRAYLKATGLSLSELKGKKCYHAWGLDRLCKDCPVTKTMETGEPQSAELTPKNQPHWPPDIGSWLSRAAPVKDETGSVIGAIEVAYNITERKQTEEKLIDYQEQLKSLASQLTLAEESERHRIATELHTSIDQSLVISKMKLDELRASTPPGELANILDEVCELLGQNIQEARTLTFDLSSPILYELGLEKAVAEWLIEQVQNKHGIKTVFIDDGQKKPLNDDMRVFLFRDIRELLFNVIKHAQAKNVKVSISKVAEQIQVTVEDDGWGFDPVKVTGMAVRTGAFGLFSIRQRLELLGGRFEINSAPGHGTRITITAPLKREK